ncbi:MAG TPA: glycogen debranching N-terminal domain-containing protein [Kineosporiaceae bacterium]|nr:glycogen debranching N-terminal domain-containing protein [Kineosporiaceae bacterium]
MTTGNRREAGTESADRRAPAPVVPATEGPPSRPLQPALHELVVAVSAPTSVLSARSGDLDCRTAGGEAHGLYHEDLRVLGVARLTLAGSPPTPVLGAAARTGTARFVGLARTLGDDHAADATVRVDRRRTVVPGALHEEVTVTSRASREVRADLVLELAPDFRPLDHVKGGFRGARVRTPVVAAAGSQWSAQPEGRDGDVPDVRVVVSSEAAVATRQGLTWPLTIAPGTSATVRWTATASGIEGPFAAADAALAADLVGNPQIRSGDDRLAWLVRRGTDDLQGLLLASRSRPADTFVAAGAPWFLTLFGRDSLWTARMLLPCGTRLAAGTLRLLAALQGRHHDPDTQEEPGKILHEVRGDAFEPDGNPRLPPLYYGTVDATLLWICLLHDAWRWGMPEAEVHALLPALEEALAWMRAAAAKGSGFIAYHDPSGRGLANQGWKDSGDAIRFAGGRLAAAPVALAEVQGYAHEAAVGAAALLDAFGRPGSEDWRSWAAGLATRFRARYWVADADGPYPALALDSDGRPVDAVASNMGHLLGTGLLDEREADLVVRRLASPDLADGYGLRTMSARMGGYSPSSYHCGSVWPHDTAIAVAGLARAGAGPRAAELVTGLLQAAVRFEGRLPELWGGDARSDVPAPVAYPGACHPQAWAAAAGVAVTTALLGLDPDVPGGVVRLRPVAPSPVAGVRASGLRLGGSRLDVEVDAAGRVVHAATDAPVRFELG